MFGILFFGFGILLFFLTIFLLGVLLLGSEKICRIALIVALGVFAIGILLTVPLFDSLQHVGASGALFGAIMILWLLALNIGLFIFSIIAFVASLIAGGFCKKLRICTAVPFCVIVLAVFAIFVASFFDVILSLLLGVNFNAVTVNAVIFLTSVWLIPVASLIAVILMIVHAWMARRRVRAESRKSQES